MTLELMEAPNPLFYRVHHSWALEIPLWAWLISLWAVHVRSWVWCFLAGTFSDPGMLINECMIKLIAHPI